MAEITTASSGDKPGVRRSKKNSTRVDLTPMVDLGFLLITFFIFTTTMSEPKAMKMVLPAGEVSDTKVKESTALTAILLDDGKIFYYHGSLDEAFASKQFGVTSFSLKDGIGALIREKQLILDQKGIGRKEPVLIIKQANSSRFSNTIDILDEVLINSVDHYAFTDLAESEKEVLVSQHIQL